MTTPVETVAPATTKQATKFARKTPIKREFNLLGKFFAKVRIDTDMTTVAWAKALGVSQLAVANVERGDAKLSFDYALKVAKVIQEKAPQYEAEYAEIVAEELGVLVIPANTSRPQISAAYNILGETYNLLRNGSPKVQTVSAE